jgi:membrane-associated phospholipid phosphatase
MVSWALLIGYSRIYLGVHYPGDVVAGMVWGAGCGWLVFQAFCRIMKIIPPSWRIAGNGQINGSGESI